MRYWLVRLSVILSLVALMATGTRAQGAGVIEGQVLNATLDGVPVPEMPVTLWMLDGQVQKAMLEETADEEGRVRFQGLDTQGYSYQLQVEHQGVSYWSDVVAFSQGQNLLSVPLTVYEATASDAYLSVERAHLILDFQPRSILVQEVQILRNSGDRTYIGSRGNKGGVTIRFPLPQGAVELQWMEEWMASSVVQTESGFAYTEPILPGIQEFFFSYKLIYQSTRYTFSREITYPIRYLDVVVADAGVRVTGSGLIAQEPLSLQGRRYLHLTGQSLAPADRLTLSLDNLPLETGPTEPSTTPPGVFARVVMVLGTLAVLLALGYPFLKPHREKEG